MHVVGIKEAVGLTEDGRMRVCRETGSHRDNTAVTGVSVFFEVGG